MAVNLMTSKTTPPRVEYSGVPLLKSDMESSPIKQFKLWYKDAIKHESMPDAMTLATSGHDGKVSARIVLLKSIDDVGLIFYSNYQSSKGIQLRDNPNAALVFYWPNQHRQVRIEGLTSQIARKDSEHYFQSRPTCAKVAASISPQSREIESRDKLHSDFEDAKNSLKDDIVALPSFWGGYKLTPEKIEFWQGQPNRMHDRILYQLYDDKWKIARLAP